MWISLVWLWKTRIMDWRRKKWVWDVFIVVDLSSLLLLKEGNQNCCLTMFVGKTVLFSIKCWFLITIHLQYFNKERILKSKKSRPVYSAIYFQHIFNLSCCHQRLHCLFLLLLYKYSFFISVCSWLCLWFVVNFVAKQFICILPRHSFNNKCEIIKYK